MEHINAVVLFGQDPWLQEFAFATAAATLSPQVTLETTWLVQVSTHHSTVVSQLCKWDAEVT